MELDGGSGKDFPVEPDAALVLASRADPEQFG
jgi:hypothetical protein